MIKSPDSDSDEDPQIERFLDERFKLFQDEGYTKNETGIYEKDGQVHPF